MEEFYKFNKAYYIKFKRVESETNLEDFVFPEFVNILGQSGNQLIAIEEDSNNQDCAVLFLPEEKVKKFVDYCQSQDLIESYEDISYDLLIHQELDSVILDMMVSDEFQEMFVQYKTKCHTIDTLLEKVKLNSEESLEPFEIELLQKEVTINRTNNLHK